MQRVPIVLVLLIAACGGATGIDVRGAELVVGSIGVGLFGALILRRFSKLT